MAKNTIQITNVAEFNKELKKAVESTELGASVVLSKVSFDVFKGLQNRTPRKTGRARAGWTNTVDKPPSNFKPPKRIGKTHSDRQFTGKGKIKYNSTINLTNNVEYIVSLDKGHSKQASNIVAYVLAKAKVMLQRLIAVESRRKIK